MISYCDSCKVRVQSLTSDVIFVNVNEYNSIHSDIAFFPKLRNKSHINLLNPSPLQTDLANASNYSLGLYNRYLIKVLIKISLIKSVIFL